MRCCPPASTILDTSPPSTEWKTLPQAVESAAKCDSAFSRSSWFASIADLTSEILSSWPNLLVTAGRSRDPTLIPGVVPRPTLADSAAKSESWASRSERHTPTRSSRAWERSTPRLCMILKILNEASKRMALALVSLLPTSTMGARPKTFLQTIGTSCLSGSTLARTSRTDEHTLSSSWVMEADSLPPTSRQAPSAATTARVGSLATMGEALWLRWGTVSDSQSTAWTCFSISCQGPPAAAASSGSAATLNALSDGENTSSFLRWTSRLRDSRASASASTALPCQRSISSTAAGTGSSTAPTPLGARALASVGAAVDGAAMDGAAMDGTDCCRYRCLVRWLPLTRGAPAPVPLLTTAAATRLPLNCPNSPPTWASSAPLPSVRNPLAATGAIGADFAASPSRSNISTTSRSSCSSSCSSSSSSSCGSVSPRSSHPSGGGNSILKTSISRLSAIFALLRSSALPPSSPSSPSSPAPAAASAVGFLGLEPRPTSGIGMASPSVRCVRMR